MWNVSQCRSEKVEPRKALIVNGRGSNSKMIASPSLAAERGRRNKQGDNSLPPDQRPGAKFKGNNLPL